MEAIPTQNEFGPNQFLVNKAYELGFKEDLRMEEIKKQLLTKGYNYNLLVEYKGLAQIVAVSSEQRLGMYLMLLAFALKFELTDLEEDCYDYVEDTYMNYSPEIQTWLDENL